MPPKVALTIEEILEHLRLGDRSGVYFGVPRAFFTVAGDCVCFSCVKEDKDKFLFHAISNNSWTLTKVAEARIQCDACASVLY